MPIGTTSNMEWLSGPGGSGSVEYTAGHGIIIDNYDHIISTDQSVVQDKLIAGDNITITNNVISAADQVQSDWAEADTSSPAYIANKPTIPTKTSDLTNDSNFITAADVPSAQVQSDWNETDSSDPAYIVNKPTIPSGNQLLPAATSSDEDKVLTVDSNGDPQWQTPQSVSQVQSDWTEDDASEASYIQHKPNTKPIQAGTGISVVEYADNIKISGTINAQVQSDWAEADSSDMSFVKNKPSTKQIVAGANITITDSQGTITISSAGAGGLPIQADWSQQDSNQLDYIKNKPTIPDAQVQSNWTESNTSSKSFIMNKPTTKSIVAGTGITITETATEIIISLA